MRDKPVQNIYVIGGAQTDFARNWSREGKEIIDLFAEAFDAALADAGLQPADIDVGHVGNFVGELFAGQGLMGGFFAQLYPELVGMPTARHEAACASGSMAILAAMRDIEAGHYDTACVLGIELMRNVNGQTGAEYLGSACWRGHEASDARFPWPHLFDQIAQRYKTQYGLEHKHLAAIAEINFDNARRNPLAQTRNWAFPEGCFGENDELNPVIDGGLRKMDCGQITDGAACVILASERRAREYASARGLQLQDLPRIKGWGHRSGAITLDAKLVAASQDAQQLLFPHLAQTLTDACQRAGFAQTAALDGLETHDCFTITEYMAIDHAGLTPPGQSWQAIEDGRISADGGFPINPSGGLIGLGHPVGATGVRMLLDISRQVSGRAGYCQIRDAQNMQMLNVGGSATTCASFVVGVG
ncbi:MAG: acetyl-CoA C-acetyltransferase [Halieaceae bacterium]|jgi:acetyl-CoA C-acetyltransferase